MPSIDYSTATLQNQSKLRQRVILAVSVTILLTVATFMFWFVPESINNFKQEQKRLASSAVKGARQNILLYLEYRQLEIDRIGIEYTDRINRIAFFPELVLTKEDYNFTDNVVSARLSSHRSFAITDSEGQPAIVKNKSPFGTNCKNNIQHFLEHQAMSSGTTSLHGSTPESYHFDVMTLTDENALFFVSFPLNSISALLANAQILHQALVLVPKNNLNTVDVGAPGVRQAIWYGDTLSDGALSRALFQMDIPNTNWRILALPEPGYIENHTQVIINWAAIFYVFLFATIAIFTWLLIRESVNRKFTQIELLEANENLEKKVLSRTQSLEKSRRRNHAIIETAVDGMISISEQGRISRFNRAAERIFGYQATEVIGQNIAMLVNENDSHKHNDYISHYLATGERSVIGPGREVVGKHKNGTPIDLLLAVADTGISGAERFSGFMRDITAVKKAESALFSEKERAQITLHALSDGVIITDIEGIVTDTNPAAEKLTGWSAEQMCGTNIKQIFKIRDHLDKREIVDHVTCCLQTQSRHPTMRQAVLLTTKTHEQITIENSAVLVRDQAGDVSGAVLTFRDITEAKKLQEQLEFDAQHDALTGMVNRKEFEKRLSDMLEKCQGAEHQCDSILCVTDLQQFKVLNDTVGHSAGDEVLRQISQVMRTNIMAQDTLARIGGDEFALILPSISVADAIEIAQSIIKDIANFQYTWENRSFRVGISIGITEIRGTGVGLDGLLSQADAACYKAKEQGRNRYHVFDIADQEIQRRQGEMRWTNKIVRAIEENRLVLYQQSIEAMNEGDQRGYNYEILVRMLDRQGEVVLPGEFFPAAERYRLMPAIDEWVVENLFNWLASHPEHLADLDKCAINLSGQSLTDELFQNRLMQLIKESKISPKKICWEVTETAAIANFDRAVNFIAQVRDLGCKFSLDDFGAGMSSFGYLKNLKVDFLKIDGGFVKDMLTDSRDMLIVKSIHQVGSGLQMKTIAEFVENDDIKMQLKGIGVDYAQGYGIAKPVPLSNFE